MKKIILLMSLFCLFSISFGQTNNITQQEADAIWAIDFWFCNDWVNNTSKTLSAATTEWKPFTMCLKFTNTSDKDMEIKANFVTADLVWEEQWKSCTLDTSIESSITNKEDLESIIIPANNYIIKEFDIVFPIGMNGRQPMCMTYEIKDPKSQWWMVAIVMRKSAWIDFFVWDIGDIENKIVLENIQTSFNNNKELILDLDVKNLWNLENTVNISWNITNILWYNKPFEIIGWNVFPDWTLKLNANLWTIASYWWLFNISFITTSTPFFSFDISSSNIDEDLLTPKTVITETTFFQTPWMIIWVAILVILLLILAFRKPKQKVVYVKQ